MTTSVDVTNTYTEPGIEQGAIEGCSNAIVSFVLPNPATQNTTIHFTIGGTATNGVDYATIPDSVVILQGQDSTALIISPYMDESRKERKP